MISVLPYADNGSGTSIRLVFGPFLPGEIIKRLFHAGTGTARVNVALAMFQNRPADTEAAFAAGTQLLGPGVGGSVVGGVPALPLRSSVTNVIPVNVKVDEFQYLGCQIDTSGASALYGYFALDVVPSIEA